MDKSCGVVLFNSGKVLLLRHSSISSREGGHWDFPKGHIDGDETEIQTALRELEEETGIAHVNVIDGFRDTITLLFQEDRSKLEKRWYSSLRPQKKAK